MEEGTKLDTNWESCICLRYILSGLIQYIHKRRFSSSRKLLAFNHYKKMIVGRAAGCYYRCFAALRLNVEVQLYKRELRGSADDFRRETLLSLGFYQWWREAQLSQDMRMLERVVGTIFSCT